MLNFQIIFCISFFISFTISTTTTTNPSTTLFNCTKSISVSTFGTPVSLAYNPVNHYLAIALPNAIKLYNLETNEWTTTSIDTTTLINIDIIRSVDY